MSYIAHRDPIKFAYWVPNVSGGLVISSIEQRTSWTARLQHQARADRGTGGLRLRPVANPLHRGLRRGIPARAGLFQPCAARRDREAQGDRRDPAWTLESGDRLQADRHHQPSSATAASRSTSSPVGSAASSTPSASRGSITTSAIAARKSSSAACAASGRRIKFTFAGDFYRFRDFSLKPKPIEPLPEIFQGGSSRAARDMASRVSDWYFTNGNTPDEIAKQVNDIQRKAAETGHKVRVGVNAFAVARETEEEARGGRPGDHRQGDSRRGQRLRPRSEERRPGFAGTRRQLGEIHLQRSRAIQRRLPLQLDWHAAADRRANPRA